jgi:hypothetical protein
MMLTKAQLLEVLNAPDTLAVVVRGHQAIESALNAAISEALPDPHALEIEKLTFALKSDLAVSLRVIRRDSRGAFLAFNRTRNRFAHHFDAAFTKKEAEDLGNTLSSWQRRVLGKAPSDYLEPRALLEKVVAVLYFECTGALRRLQQEKLADEVLHEIVQETLAKAPPPPENKFHSDVQREMQVRMTHKQASRNLPPTDG